MITDKRKISSRIGRYTTHDCYITIKVHKPDFEPSYTTGIINPSRPEISRIGK